MKQGTSGPAGRLAALYASLCLRVWSEFRGIPPREPPICFRRKRKKEKGTPKRRERAQQGASPRHTTPLSSRSCTAVSLPFSPVPVPVLCGRLLHKGQRSRGSPLFCVIWHNSENGDVTTEGKRPVAHPGRCLPPRRVQETPFCSLRRCAYRTRLLFLRGGNLPFLGSCGKLWLVSLPWN